MAHADEAVASGSFRAGSAPVVTIMLSVYSESVRPSGRLEIFSNCASRRPPRAKGSRVSAGRCGPAARECRNDGGAVADYPRPL
eukprot:5081827-Prymnesium_polylepis.1